MEIKMMEHGRYFRQKGTDWALDYFSAQFYYFSSSS